MGGSWDGGQGREGVKERGEEWCLWTSSLWGFCGCGVVDSSTEMEWSEWMAWETAVVFGL